MVRFNSILKRYYFFKFIYPDIYKNIELANKDKNAILIVDIDKNILNILIIINFKAIFISKSNIFNIENYYFSKNNKNLDNKLQLFLKKNKLSPILIKNNNFVETFFESINNIKNTFNLTLEEQFNIWQKLFSVAEEYFQPNEHLLLIPIDSFEKNYKWID